MGEEVDRPAEEDRVQKGDGGEGQVGQGQGDGQGPHRPQQPEDPAVDADEKGGAHGLADVTDSANPVNRPGAGPPWEMPAGAFILRPAFV